jgi:hypothetical protein
MNVRTLKTYWANAGGIDLALWNRKAHEVFSREEDIEIASV